MQVVAKRLGATVVNKVWRHVVGRWSVVLLYYLGRYLQNVAAAHLKTTFIQFFYSPNIIRVCRRVNGERGGWRRVRYNVNMRVKSVSCTANFQCADEQWVFWFRHIFDWQGVTTRKVTSRLRRIITTFEYEWCTKLS
jgi:hypothetical protein